MDVGFGLHKIVVKISKLNSAAISISVIFPSYTRFLVVMALSRAKNAELRFCAAIYLCIVATRRRHDIITTFYIMFQQQKRYQSGDFALGKIRNFHFLFFSVISSSPHTPYEKFIPLL